MALLPPECVENICILFATILPGPRPMSERDQQTNVGWTNLTNHLLDKDCRKWLGPLPWGADFFLSPESELWIISRFGDPRVPRNAKRSGRTFQNLALDHLGPSTGKMSHLRQPRVKEQGNQTALLNSIKTMSPIPQGLDCLLNGRRIKGSVTIFNLPHLPLSVVERITCNDL